MPIVENILCVVDCTEIKGNSSLLLWRLISRWLKIGVLNLHGEWYGHWNLLLMWICMSGHGHQCAHSSVLGAQPSQLCLCFWQHFSKHLEEEGVEDILSCSSSAGSWHQKSWHAKLPVPDPGWEISHASAHCTHSNSAPLDGLASRRWDRWFEVVLWGIVPSSVLGGNDGGGKVETGWELVLAYMSWMLELKTWWVQADGWIEEGNELLLIWIIDNTKHRNSQVF